MAGIRLVCPSVKFPCLLLLLGLLMAASVAPAAPPNLVFILTDDQRYDALGCAGNALIQTPQVDRLAAEGIRFRQNFVTTSICCVSRASIFLGQYGRRHGIGDFASPFTAAQWAESYPARLRGAGFRTGFVGKFGVGNAASIATYADQFDFWKGLPGQGAKTFINPRDPSQTHETARLGNEALEFLDGCTAGQPFCLSISFTAPHARDGQPREFEPDSRDRELYADVNIPPPATATDALFQRLPDFVQHSEGRRRWEKRFATPEMALATDRDYYRLVTGIDREVGRIVEKLGQLGFGANTVIVFTSDNGFFLGERGLADKWLTYEESIRTPLVIYDPRLPAAQRGRTVDAMALNIDLAPTLLDLAGVAAPAQMQGRSLVPLFSGPPPAGWRTSFLHEHHTLSKLIPPNEGLRTERWAYVRWMAPNPESEELYDLQADPLEQKNLAGEKEFAGTLAELRRDWEQARSALR